MNRNLYSVICTVDNGWTKERWEAFVFADCPNTARYIATTFFEKQSMETVAYDTVVKKIDYENINFVCARRVEH